MLAAGNRASMHKSGKDKGIWARQRQHLLQELRRSLATDPPAITLNGDIHLNCRHICECWPVKEVKCKQYLILLFRIALLPFHMILGGLSLKRPLSPVIGHTNNPSRQVIGVIVVDTFGAPVRSPLLASAPILQLRWVLPQEADSCIFLQRIALRRKGPIWLGYYPLPPGSVPHLKGDTKDSSSVSWEGGVDNSAVQFLHQNSPKTSAGSSPLQFLPWAPLLPLLPYRIFLRALLSYSGASLRLCFLDAQLGPIQWDAMMNWPKGRHMAPA